MFAYPSTGIYATTTYSYDVLDDLTGVTQGGQSRTFSYDSLKRLKQATNPESGTVNYTYDNNSNLETKIDARSIKTVYAYDALNRPTSRTYVDDPENTPSVSYKYDSQILTDGSPVAFSRGFSTGRLVSVTYGGTSAGSYTGYDQLGRPNVSYQQTDSQNYGFSYSYDLASEMISETYPSGRVVQTGYDAAGRIAGVKNQATQLYYAGAIATDATNRIQYASHGAISAMKLGNGKWEHTTYDPKRLQPTQIGLGVSSADSSLLKLDYTYGTTSNNGNVLAQTITIGSTVMSQSYTYDDVNRLLTASENSGASWSQTYGYDRFGNRWVSASTGYALSSLTPQSQSAFNMGNNRLVSSGYDNAGNQTGDSQSRIFTYDAENRQITFNGYSGQYFYDGDGRRVKKIDGAGTTVFVYNNGGQLIAEYHSDQVPAPAGGGGTSYLTSDDLGSTRVVTKSDGTVKARYDYLPFGEELGSGIGQRTTGLGYSLADTTTKKFTQKERDSESGLDYFIARYYSSAQGRFTSVDPMLSSGRDSNPQSWNRYVYVFDNPTRWVDPSGMDPKDDEERRRRAEQAAADLEAAQLVIDQLMRDPDAAHLVVYVAGINNANQKKSAGGRDAASRLTGGTVVSASNRSGLRDGRNGVANEGTAQAVADIVKYALGAGLKPEQITIIAFSNGAPSLAKGLETLKNDPAVGVVEFNSIKLYAPNTSDVSLISAIGEFAKPGSFTLTNSTKDGGLFAADWFSSRDANRSPKEWKRALQNVDVQVIQTRQFIHSFKAYASEELKGKAKPVLP